MARKKHYEHEPGPTPGTEWSTRRYYSPEKGWVVVWTVIKKVLRVYEDDTRIVSQAQAIHEWQNKNDK